MNKTSKILLGFATGALAGIIAGLLVAPDNDTRKDLISKKDAKKWAKNIRKHYRDSRPDIKG